MIDKKIQQSISDNVFVFAMLRQEEIIPQPALTPILVKSISNFINENTYSSVVLIIRSDKEPYQTGYPPSELVTQLENEINKDTYLFYQNPWPEAVPNFDDSDTMYVQLGFDESNAFHKSKEVKEKGQEYVFLTNKQMFKLNKKNNELI